MDIEDIANLTEDERIEILAEKSKKLVDLISQALCFEHFIGKHGENIAHEEEHTNIVHELNELYEQKKVEFNNRATIVVADFMEINLNEPSPNQTIQ